MSAVHPLTESLALTGQPAESKISHTYQEREREREREREKLVECMYNNDPYLHVALISGPHERGHPVLGLGVCKSRTVSQHGADLLCLTCVCVCVWQHSRKHERCRNAKQRQTTQLSVILGALFNAYYRTRRLPALTASKRSASDTASI